MGIKLAIGTHYPGFGRANLTTDMKGRADTPQRASLRIGRPNDIEVDLRSGVAPTSGQLGLNRTPQSKVQQGRIPSAMNRAEGVVMFKLRRCLKYGESVTQLNEVAIKRVCHVRMWQITMEQGGHDLQSCLAFHLRRTGQTSFAATPTELSLPYFRYLGIPSAQSVVNSIFNVHRTLITTLPLACPLST